MRYSIGMKSAFFIVVVLTCITSIASGQGSGVNLQKCEVPGTEPGKKDAALCGKIEVFEDRAGRSGRKIPINIVVYPATGSEKSPDPLVYIPGGPGSSATEDAPYVAKDLAKIRERRDLVFIDLRGTGGSNQLYCELFDPKDISSYLTHWNPPAAVRACRDQLEKASNLKLYTTEIAVDDLDDARRALGYQKLNLSGSSYGTRAVMAYVKRHGLNVRSVWLHGVSPFDQFMPGEFPLHTQRALDGVLDECLKSTDCGKAFPNVKKDERAVLERLRKGPVEVDVSIDNKPLKVKLTRDLAAEAVRYMLYQSRSASRLPLIINQASKGNFAPLAEAAIFYRRVIVATGATGFYLTVTCAEDLPFAKLPDGNVSENTFLGSYRLREQREACAVWPQGKVSKSYFELVRSDVPALIYSGQWDPVTPPSYGDRVAKLLPNSLHIVVPSGGHGFGGLSGLECLESISTKFVETANTNGIDTSCVKSIKRPGFQLAFTK